MEIRKGWWKLKIKESFDFDPGWFKPYKCELRFMFWIPQIKFLAVKKKWREISLGMQWLSLLQERPDVAYRRKNKGLPPLPIYNDFKEDMKKTVNLWLKS